MKYFFRCVTVVAMLAALCLTSAGCELADKKNQPPDVLEVLAFAADWCQACKQDRPILKAIERDGFRVFWIDSDRDPTTVRRYAITSLPTYVVLINGVETLRTSSAATLKSALQ